MDVPLVGTWIETKIASTKMKIGAESFPSWERGLKQHLTDSYQKCAGRSPRGNVD